MSQNWQAYGLYCSYKPVSRRTARSGGASGGPAEGPLAYDALTCIKYLRGACCDAQRAVVVSEELQRLFEQLFAVDDVGVLRFRRTFGDLEVPVLQAFLLYLLPLCLLLPWCLLARCICSAASVVAASVVCLL